MNIVTSKSKLPSNSYGCELPPAAAMKLRRLRETRELNSAAYRATSDRFISEAHPALLQAQHNLRVLTDRNISTAYLKSGPKPAADSDLVVSAKQILEEAQAEFDRAIEVRDNCGARVHAGLHAISSVERYLQRADNFVFEAAKTPAVKLKTGESFISALDIVRAKIATARAEVERARIAPRPSSDAKKRVRATVANLAARGRPDLLDLVERGGEIAWPTVSVATQNADPFVGGVGYGEMPNSLAVFAWLHGDALITKLELEIDRIADDGAALSDQDRQRIDKTARSELLELGHIEEQLVMMAEDVGQTIDRRRDCDPRCVLGVVGPEPK